MSGYPGVDDVWPDWVSVGQSFSSSPYGPFIEAKSICTTPHGTYLNGNFYSSTQKVWVKHEN